MARSNAIALGVLGVAGAAGLVVLAQVRARPRFETPPELGGLGGWFPDEVARAQRSSFQGLDFGPSGYAAA